METVTDFIFLGSKMLQMVTAAMKLKTLGPWKKSYDKPAAVPNCSVVSDSLRYHGL